MNRSREKQKEIILAINSKKRLVLRFLVDTKKMRKPLIAFGLITLIFLAQMIVTAPVPRKSLLTQLNPNYVRAMAAFKRLEPKLTREELRAITTIGILNGAREAEEKMEQYLIEVVRDLVENTDVNDRKVIVPKIEKIEGQVTRDQHALEVLTSAMDLAMGKISIREFRKEMQQTLQEIKRNKENLTQNQENNPNDEQLMDEAVYSDFIGNKISNLRQHILSEMDIMKNMVGKKIENTLEHIIDEADENGLIAQASERIIQKRAAGSRTHTYHMAEPAEVRMINSILSEADFRHNLIEDGIEKRNDINDSFDEFELNDLNKNVNANANVNVNGSNNKNPTRKPTNSTNSRNNLNNNLNNNIRDVIKAVVANINTNTTNTTNTTSTTAPTNSSRPAKQEAASQELAENGSDDFGAGDDGGGDGGGGGGGGGLVGIITGLSGGEGGSDVGALIGALTGVISTLFGPGGLDIESLISTGTSLISGLLAGNKNFGTVLGTYVGTALDGLSGGGGAINNGQFIGNFLGTVVASLSADPEDDDAGLKPLLFVENLLNSFIDAKNRKDSEEGSEERKGDSSGHAPPKKEGGSDSGAFVKGLVSHLVSQAISLILNASLGAVSGASQASTSLFASSSHNKW